MTAVPAPLVLASAVVTGWVIVVVVVGGVAVICAGVASGMMRGCATNVRVAVVTTVAAVALVTVVAVVVDVVMVVTAVVITGVAVVGVLVVLTAVTATVAVAVSVALTTTATGVPVEYPRTSRVLCVGVDVSVAADVPDTATLPESTKSAVPTTAMHRRRIRNRARCP